VHETARPAGVEGDSDVFDLVSRHAQGSADLAPGVRVSTNIRLIALLGAGGMGNVWLAHHGSLETQVAVKFMSSELESDAALAARFGTEARLAARIKSPHVVTILDYATTARGVPYIVMELLEGEDLETRLRGGRRLGLEESSRVLVQICKALSKAHALGIVHRDIKPDNVFLVDHEGESFIKVLDFGIAKDERRDQNVTAAGTTMGTPSFMSPEQLFRPKEVDLRSDLWSAAVVVYRCLTGRLPFECDNFGSMCIAIHDGGFVLPSAIDSSLPRTLDGWFQRALRVDASQRFQSASEMANAYLAELHKARLLPAWAMARGFEGDRPSYSSDPGGISGGPIVVRQPRRVHAGAIFVGLLVAAAAIVAASPERDALVDVVTHWIDAQFEDAPPLAPTPEEPPPVFHDPSPSLPSFASPPALAPRDAPREPALPGKSASPRDPYDPPVLPREPADSPFGI
jgi:serine/threonine-protein kinase